MLKLALASTKTTLKKWFTFKGRASRAEYWWSTFGIFILFSIVCLLIVVGLYVVLGPLGAMLLVGPILGLVGFLMNFMWLSLGCRRLHDINKSGWWQLIMIVPVIGVIVLLVFYCKRTKDGAERYGEPSPLQETKRADWLVPFTLAFLPGVLFLLLAIFSPTPSDRETVVERRGERISRYTSFTEPSAPALQTDPSFPVAPAAPATPADPSASPSAPAAPVSPVTAPAGAVAPAMPVMNANPAPVPPSAPPLDACEQRLADHAVANNADPKAYIAANQAYLVECRKILSPQPQ